MVLRHRQKYDIRNVALHRDLRQSQSKSRKSRKRLTGHLELIQASKLNPKDKFNLSLIFDNLANVKFIIFLFFLHVVLYLYNPIHAEASKGKG